MITTPEPIPDRPDLEFLRAPGDVLHPERFTKPMVLRTKANLSPRIWSALYQQRPIPDEGLYFRRDDFRRVPTLPVFRTIRLITAWDFAIGEKSMNDYTVGTTFAHTPDDLLYLGRMNRFKRDTYEIVNAMIEEAKRCLFLTQDYMVGVEDGQIWKTLEPVLRKEMRKQRAFFTIHVLKPLSDKMVRARPLQARIQQHTVVFAEDMQGLREVETELLQFPAGKHDDIVDSMAWATQLSLETTAPRERDEKPIKSWKDKLKGLTNKHTGYMTS
jgi:predicted phage terminase large subunit-like protein